MTIIWYFFFSLVDMPRGVSNKVFGMPIACQCRTRVCGHTTYTCPRTRQIFWHVYDVPASDMCPTWTRHPHRRVRAYIGIDNIKHIKLTISSIFDRYHLVIYQISATSNSGTIFALYIHTYIYTQMYTYMYINICIYIHIQMYMYMQTYMYMCIQMYMYVYMKIVYTLTYTHTYLHTHVCIYISIFSDI